MENICERCEQSIDERNDTCPVCDELFCDCNGAGLCNDCIEDNMLQLTIFEDDLESDPEASFNN